MPDNIDANPPMTDALVAMIARLTAQRACLDFAAAHIAGLAGTVLEVGLGKGRTHDRLRKLFPDRRILAFDFEVHCPARLAPPAENLILGDFRQTLPDAAVRMPASAALVHADIGSQDRDADAELAGDIAPAIAALTRPGGLVISDRDLPLPAAGWTRVALPGEAAETGWPYFMSRANG